MSTPLVPLPSLQSGPFLQEESRLAPRRVAHFAKPLAAFLIAVDVRDQRLAVAAVASCPSRARPSAMVAAPTNRAAVNRDAETSAFRCAACAVDEHCGQVV